MPADQDRKMRGYKVFRKMRPFVSIIAVLVLAVVLVVTIYITHLNLQWSTFLAGILVAALLAETSRISRAEWFARRRTAQLSSLKTKLDQETQLRKRAEDALATVRPRLRMFDEALPVMVAFIDREGRCRYSNHAFAVWLHLQPEQINGRHLRELLGYQIYQHTEEEVRQVLAGRNVHYERNEKMPDGTTRRLLADYLPQISEDAKVDGFFIVIADITGKGDVCMLPEAAHYAPSITEPAERDQFADEADEEAMPEDVGGLILAAIEKDEFCLYSQRIMRLGADPDAPGHYEVLVRLKEEEESLMPPGAFFPLAEKYGLMPHLDRWVVQHVVEWLAQRRQEGMAGDDSMYFINISSATISDPGFPRFLQRVLRENDVPCAALCFEIPNQELAQRNAVVVEFAQKVRRCGCRVAISGFGEGRLLFDMIRGFQVELLKIDGSVILNMLRDPVDMAKVTSIGRIARKIGVETVAEMVESEEVIARLGTMGIDFAQGFGISSPRPLGE